MRPTRRPPSPFALPLLLLILLAANAAGPASARSFGEAISITEIEIPVRVLRDGEPVRGLTADDFSVLDQGEPAEIVGFRAIDVERPAPPVSEVDRGAHTAEGRHILYLFDLVLTTGQRLDRALHQGRDTIVSQLRPGDRVAVAYLTASGGRVLLGFTDDPTEIATALDLIAALLDGHYREFAAGAHRLALAQGLTTGPGPDADDVRDDVDMVRLVAGSRTVADSLTHRFGAAATVAVMGGGAASAPGGWGQTLGGVGVPSFDDAKRGFIPRDDVAARIFGVNPFALNAGVYSAETASRVKAQTDQISEIATLLRDVPGPKHILLVTRGFPSSVIYSRDAPPERPLVLRYLQSMFEALQRSGWTLHVFDAEGLRNAFVVEGLAGPSDAGSHHHALYYVAAQTGGELYNNFNRLPDATERLMRATSVSYILTIRAPENLPTDGRMRRLKVRLKETPPGTRVHHRAGYFTPRPTAERSPLEQQLDAVDLILGEDVIEGFPVGLVVETKGVDGAAPTDGLVPLRVVVELPPELFGHAGGATEEVRIQLYAVDDRGGVQDLWMRRIVLDREKVGARLAEAGLRVAGDLSLPPGAYRVRSLVQHPGSDRFTLSTTEVAVRAVTQ